MPQSTISFVERLFATFDCCGAMTATGTRIGLTRPGERHQQYAGDMLFDGLVFSYASYTSNCSLNSDRSRFVEGVNCSFNVHPAGTSAIENDLRHTGECLIVEFQDGLVNETLEDAFGLRQLDRSITNGTDERITRLAQELRHSVVTAQRGDYVNALYVDGLLVAVRAVLAEAYQSSASAEWPGQSGRRLEDARIARAIDYIEAHVGEALTVAEIASVATLSEGYFSRAFKAATGEPVWAFVQRRRVERAKSMLETTQLSIAEIAHACGFANQGHLTSCFRRRFGVTPGAVRRNR